MSLSSVSLIDINHKKIWEDKTAKTISFFCKQLPVRVDAMLIGELKHIAQSQGGKNIRLCLHDSPQAIHHDMIILEYGGKYYRPHKHLKKGEAFHIIEGQMGIFVFNEDGTVMDSCCLNSGEIFRVGVGMYHMVMPITEWVIYHENKPGPFLIGKDSIYPSWAPDGKSQVDNDDYLKSLIRHFDI
jgi:cupin fold WbuC family metalloprotein